jgi:pyrimidine deaminase RibD-like protein
MAGRNRIHWSDASLSIAVGSIVGWGYHRQFGGPHAEIVALQRAGSLAAGATLYCTLEPCNHKGKTGPCTQAIIDAKIGRVRDRAARSVSARSRRDGTPARGGKSRSM